MYSIGPAAHGNLKPMISLIQCFFQSMTKGTLQWLSYGNGLKHLLIVVYTHTQYSSFNSITRFGMYKY